MGRKKKIREDGGMADALDSGSSVHTDVRVQIPFLAPKQKMKRKAEIKMKNSTTNSGSNSKLENFKTNMKGLKVAVLGIGISHTPLVRFLYKLGAKITVFDAAEESKIAKKIVEFEDLEIEFSFGENYLSELKNGFDFIFRTPGMRPDVPELVDAVNSGAFLTSEMEVFMKLCPAQVFGVTGSDGKTTTTTLISKMLEAEGYKCWTGGNIGTPLLDKIEEIEVDDKVILELSSFQLMTMKKSPNVAVITNISPNHLDYHKSYREYVEAKKNIFLNQTLDCNQNKSRVVLNFDCPDTRDMKSEISTSMTELIWFARTTKLDAGVWVEDGWIIYNGYKIMKTSDICIPGEHNVENYLAAIAATAGYVSVNSVLKIAREFQGVEHRLEFVRELNGVKYYNDSIASSPSRTSAGLHSFGQPIILLAGGKDKGIPYDDFGETIARCCKKVILIGATADKIHESLNNYVKESGEGKEIEIFRCSTYADLVRTAQKIADPGDIVMLSPASTSFDMFTNFEERGKVFKELVNKL